MGGFFAAWMVGEGIIAWRWKKAGAPPTPGALLLPSALYLGLAFAAEYAPARGVATAFAWALDAAILLQIVGKNPTIGQTGWPPLCIPAGQFMPSAAGGVACTSAQSAASGSDTNNSGFVGLGSPGPSVGLQPTVPGAPNITPGSAGGTTSTLV